MERDDLFTGSEARQLGFARSSADPDIVRKGRKAEWLHDQMRTKIKAPAVRRFLMFHWIFSVNRALARLTTFHRDGGPECLWRRGIRRSNC